jgi:hypothetical protein
VPLVALRDLIGLCRALYTAWRTNGAGPIELDELTGIGRELRAAFELARRTKPDTLGHRAAWSRAEAAARRLGHLVGELESLRPTVTAATKRISGQPPPPTIFDEREAKRRAERTRR